VSIAGEANRDARAYYATSRVPVLAWSPLGSGFFSSRPDAAGRARRHPTYGTAANALRLQRAEVLAKKYGRTPAQIALAYLYSHPFAVSAVVAASSTAHMKENLDATSLALSTAEVGWLETGQGSEGT
jgi:aryl-alcohol dehydrogenase-like predicted oxidoreductase